MSAEGMANITLTIKHSIENQEIAVAVTIVARRGKVAHFEAQGMQDIEAGKPMPKDSIFRIYSVIKAVVTVAAMHPGGGGHSGARHTGFEIHPGPGGK